MAWPPVQTARLAAGDLPVLCVDSCSLLDIMRDPGRESARPHEAEASLRLLNALEAGALLVLVADQVRAETAVHADGVAAEAENAVRSIVELAERVQAVAGVFRPGPIYSLGHVEGHVARARAVYDRWLSAATPVPQGSNIAAQAWGRVAQARTPSAKGKESVKDCVVVESYLEAVHALRVAGLTSKVVFASSNTTDFCGKGRAVAKPDLAADFDVLDLVYAPNLAAARHALGL